MESLFKPPYQLPAVEQLFTPNLYRHIGNYYAHELASSSEHIARFVADGIVENECMSQVLDGGVIDLRWPIGSVLGLALIESYDDAIAHAGKAVQTGLERACDTGGIDRTAVGFNILGGICKDDRTMMGFVISKKDYPPPSK